VIDVKATGLCRSDWHGWKGHDTDIRLPSCRIVLLPSRERLT
jgi:D-arabinose 1-dehydrogenase-like Zn-dependent alcohol dehydrogenase